MKNVFNSAALLLLLMVTFSNASCQKDTFGFYNEREYVRMNASKPFILSNWPEINSVQRGTGFVFKSPVYTTGGEAERFAVTPNSNNPRYVNMQVLVHYQTFDNFGKLISTREYVAKISCKVTVQPQNAVKYWSSPGFEYFGEWYYDVPLEIPITLEIIAGPDEVWAMKAN
jgi:hypothetical protein